MTYRPQLSDKTKKTLEKVKKDLKESESEDENLEKLPYRRDNGTFDVDYLIRVALRDQL